MKLREYLSEQKSRDISEIEKRFLTACYTLDKVWKLIRTYDSKNETDVWGKIARNSQKADGLLNDILTIAIAEMKKDVKKPLVIRKMQR